MVRRFDFASARRQMVEQQIRTWAAHEPAVLEVLGRLPREEFAPAAFRTLAYADLGIPLGHGAVMEPPSYVGRVLAVLRPRRGERFLEVGTGSGYLAACLGELGVTVHGVEIEPALAARARRVLAALVPDARLVVENADIHTWRGPREVYDAVILGGSLPAWDPSFLEALRPGGRLYAVIGRPPLMRARLFTRAPDGAGVSSRDLFETLLAPLRGLESDARGDDAPPVAARPAEAPLP